MCNTFSPYETAFIDGASRQYRYEFDFHPTNADLLDAVLSGYTTYSRQEFDCTVKNNLLCIEFAGDILGTADFKVNMVSDFLGRGDPVRVFILEATKETGCYRAAIDFYQDRRKRNDWREQTVVALNAYKGSEKQETIACISAGQELSISDELTGQGHPLPVYYQSSPIGVLPASIQRRVEDEGGELCTFERSECVGQNSKGDPIEQPYIRIYW